jgi:dihydroorotase-like cyclic amidohydrolase
MYTNPRQIYVLPVQESTWIEIDPDYSWEIHAQNTYTRCGWTPFEGWRVRGLVKRSSLRGEIVYQDGEVIAKRGFGRNVREVG